jgi:hypothetical protein
MTKKTIITIVNVVSALAILVYPLFLINAFMAFDAPGSGYDIGTWVIFLCLIFYPAFIIALIIASRKKQSLVLALLAIIPLLLLLFIILFGLYVFYFVAQ